MQAAIYCRLSVDPTGEKPSLGRQEKECRERAAREGWEVVRVYKDSDTSAFKEDVKRPEFEQLMEDARKGSFSKLIVFKADRIHRRMLQALQTFSELEKAGVEVISLNDPGLDNAIVRAVITGIAEQESKNTSIRVTAAKKEAAEKGIPGKGGTRPFGLNKEWTELVPEEAELIREAANRILRGEGITAVIKDWGERGIVGVNGKPFARTSLRQILVSPRTAGLSEYKGQIVAEGTWPPILERDVWDRLVLHFNKTKKIGSRTTSKYLLKPEIIMCGKCGARMNGSLITQNKRKTAPRYRCPQCGGVSIQAAFVEEAVWSAVALAYEEKKLQAVLSASRASEVQTEADSLLAALEGLQARLRQATSDFYEEQILPREVFVDTAKALNEQIAKAQARLSEIQALDILGDIKPGQSLLNVDKPLAWKKKIVELTIENVTIQPSKTRGSKIPDLSRIELRWRV